jgi:hypothetical protein
MQTLSVVLQIRIRNPLSQTDLYPREILNLSSKELVTPFEYLRLSLEPGGPRQTTRIKESQYKHKFQDFTLYQLKINGVCHPVLNSCDCPNLHYNQPP